MRVAPLSTSNGIPANPSFAILQMVGAGGPDKNRHRLSAFGYDLNERVAHGPEVPQEVFSGRAIVQLVDGQQDLSSLALSNPCYRQPQ